jgi:small subunit ribosomal protein S14
MAKQSIIERQIKREKLVLRFREKRSLLLEEISRAKTLIIKMNFHRKLQKLPRDSGKIRLRNRCWRTGRGRGFYKDFGLCRHMIREMAHNGLLPGLYKASW